MKFQKLIFALFFAPFLFSCGEKSGNIEEQTKDLTKPDETMEKVSYSIGMDLGSNFRKDSIKVNLDYFMRGINDGLKDAKEPLLTKVEIDSTMAQFQQQLYNEQKAKQDKALEEFNDLGRENEKSYKQFLENNKKQAGIKTTASGLQYKITKQGTGATPADEDVATVHFVAKLANGKEFDNTYKRNQPVDLPVKAVVPGWSEALKLMKTGGKATFWIPPDLAYKGEGAPPAIPPYSVLVFDIELLGVKKGEGAKAMEGLRQRRGM